MDLQYTNSLVKNLINISELNAQISEYIHLFSKNDSLYLSLEQEFKTENLFSFLMCLNIDVKYSFAKKIAFGSNKSPEIEAERLAVNIQSVFDYINNSSSNEEFNSPIFVHINKVLLFNIKDIWDSAKFIINREDIDDSYEFNKKENIIFENRINEYFSKIVSEYKRSELPEIIKIPFLYSTLSQSNIFISGNDAVYLSVIMFLYRKIGFNPFVNYFKIIKAVNNVKDDKELFVEKFIYELLKNLKDIKVKLSNIKEDVLTEIDEYVDINNRQIKGLSYIKDKGLISREIYSRLNNISSITAYRDLNNLLQKNYVKVEGIGKGTKYLLK